MKPFLRKSPQFNIVVGTLGAIYKRHPSLTEAEMTQLLEGVYGMVMLLIDSEERADNR